MPCAIIVPYPLRMELLVDSRCGLMQRFGNLDWDRSGLAITIDFPMRVYGRCMRESPAMLLLVSCFLSRL